MACRPTAAVQGAFFHSDELTVLDELVRCTVCGRPGEHTDPLIPDPFYEGVQIHLHCLNAPEGRAWTEARASEDPGYARYLSLITVGRPVTCDSCGAAERLSPKAYGMSGGIWELNCVACHRHAAQLNAYRSLAERGFVQRLELLRQRFLRSTDPELPLAETGQLAGEVDDELSIPHCECGAHHSAAALPRCGQCAAVLEKSPFHISLRAAT